MSLWPLLRLALEGVAPGGRLDLAIVAGAFARPQTWVALRHTLATAIAGTVLSLAIGGTIALTIGLTDIRGKALLVFAFMLPLLIAPQVTALAWLQVFGPSSPLLAAIGIAPAPGSPNPLHGPGGIALLLGLQHAPLVFLTLRAGLRGLPRELIEAAESAGAGRTRILTTVILPLMMPSLAAGAMLALTSAIGNFGIPALLGIPGGYTVLTTLIYQRLAGFGPAVLSEVAALSLLLGGIVIAGITLQGWLLRGEARLIPEGGARTLWPLGRWRRPIEVASWSFLALVLVLPLASLVATSLTPAYGVRLTWKGSTLEHYAYVLFEHGATRRAFRNSFALAAGAALALMAVSSLLGYFIAWRGSRLARLTGYVADIPYALPGVVLAVAMILIFLKPLPILGISLYNTLWIIFAAYLARFLPIALRPAVAGYRQLDRALEEAAESAGAGFFRRWLEVILPLVAPAAAAGAILVFLISFSELTVSALLWSAGAETVGVILFALEQGGDSVSAAAVAVLTVIATVAAMAAGWFFSRRLPPGILPWQA
ncbi:MAG: iron ABC transporter permease [Proteobacteria bacterium]|nr:iron ABC transporter permease [Pseudomonadota bacterium]MBI3499916.1 iron ABC transporter permease [Pseudomonadota bacterium]